MTILGTIFWYVCRDLEMDRRSMNIAVIKLHHRLTQMLSSLIQQSPVHIPYGLCQQLHLAQVCEKLSKKVLKTPIFRLRI